MSGKTTALAVGLAVLMALTLAACNAHTERPPSGDALMEQGQGLYVEFCAECHQTDGTGWSTLYPRLAGNPIVTLHDPEPIIMTVKYGQGSMMPFRARLGSEEIAAILTYIRNSWGNHAAPVAPHQIN